MPAKKSTRKTSDERYKLLFAESKQQKELNLSELLLKDVNEFILYLSEKFESEPSEDLVYEMLIENSLNSETEFKTWKNKKKRNSKKSSQQKQKAEKPLTEITSDAKDANFSSAEKTAA